MPKVEFTSMSSRGQVVIPQDIRKQMGLEEGTKFVVFSDGENLLMKPLLTPNMTVFKKLLRDSHAYARRAGLKRSDVKKAIQRVRRAGGA
jgi:antitoxin PrlF